VANFLRSLLGNRSTDQELLPAEVREIESRRLGRVEAYIRSRGITATARYLGVSNDYLQELIAIRKSILTLYDLKFERQLQDERFKNFDHYADIQLDSILEAKAAQRTKRITAEHLADETEWTGKLKARKAKDAYEDYEKSRGTPTPVVEEEKPEPRAVRF
jgi:hypothetical protein